MLCFTVKASVNFFPPQKITYVYLRFLPPPSNKARHFTSAFIAPKMIAFTDSISHINARIITGFIGLATCAILSLNNANVLIFRHLLLCTSSSFSQLNRKTTHPVNYYISSLALQLFMSFGLHSYFVPLLPLLRSLFPVLHSHLSQITSHVVFPS